MHFSHYNETHIMHGMPCPNALRPLLGQGMCGRRCRQSAQILGFWEVRAAAGERQALPVGALGAPRRLARQDALHGQQVPPEPKP